MNTTLYTGVTNDISRRYFEHLEKQSPNSFTAKYNLNKLIYIESFNKIDDAIRREKQIKGWKREKKMRLILEINKDLEDLGKYN